MKEDLEIPSFLRRGLDDPAHQRRMEREKRLAAVKLAASHAKWKTQPAKDPSKKKPVKESVALIKGVIAEDSYDVLEAEIDVLYEELFEARLNKMEAPAAEIHRALANHHRSIAELAVRFGSQKSAHVDKWTTTARHHNYLASQHERACKKYSVKEELDENAQTINKKIEHHRNRVKAVSAEIDRVVRSGGRIGHGDPLSAKISHHRNQVRKLMKQKISAWNGSLHEAHTLSDAREAAVHHYAMYQYHSKMGNFHEKNAMNKMGTKHEAPAMARADHHYRRANQHDRAMEKAHHIMSHAEHFDEAIDEGAFRGLKAELMKKQDREEEEARKDGKPDKLGDARKRTVSRLASDLADKMRKNEGVDATEAERRKLTTAQAKKQAVDDAKKRRQMKIQEGRGRPRKDGAATEEPDEHPIIQLRKAIALRGQRLFKFQDGGKHAVTPAEAHHALGKHDSLSHHHKMAFAARLAASHKSFKQAVRESLMEDVLAINNNEKGDE